MRRSALAWAVACFGFLAARQPSPARAQASASAGDDSVRRVERSDQLFSEAKREQRAGDLSSACDDFDRSLALAPRSGTSLNLGLCREQQGRLVEARSALQLTLRLLNGAGARQDRIQIARVHLHDVEAALSWLDLTLAPGLVNDKTVLSVDGVVVDLKQGAAPIDQGRHFISISVDHASPRTFDVSIGPHPEHRTIFIASPVPAAGPPRTVSPAAPPLARETSDKVTAQERSNSHISRWWWVVLSGVVVTASATFLVLRSRPEYPASDVRVSYP